MNEDDRFVALSEQQEEEIGKAMVVVAYRVLVDPNRPDLALATLEALQASKIARDAWIKNYEKENGHGVYSESDSTSAVATAFMAMICGFGPEEVAGCNTYDGYRLLAFARAMAATFLTNDSRFLLDDESSLGVDS